MRKTDKKKPPFRIILTFFLATSSAFFLLKVQPDTAHTIYTFTVILTLLIYLTAGFFLKNRLAFLSALYIFLFLIINYLTGFNLFNNLLMVAFIIGLGIFIN